MAARIAAGNSRRGENPSDHGNRRREAPWPIGAHEWVTVFKFGDSGRRSGLTSRPCALLPWPKHRMPSVAHSNTRKRSPTRDGRRWPEARSSSRSATGTGWAWREVTDTMFRAWSGSGGCGYDPISGGWGWVAPFSRRSSPGHVCRMPIGFGSGSRSPTDRHTSSTGPKDSCPRDSAGRSDRTLRSSRLNWSAGSRNRSRGRRHSEQPGTRPGAGGRRGPTLRGGPQPPRGPGGPLGSRPPGHARVLRRHARSPRP